ncbi:MAG TPA: hypothetical protein VMU17_07435 [Elusimicrobiota bacterium]|nr:hypothetical protein [Elusimicrobiota bacterium]
MKKLTTKGQGTTEYIVILAIVILIALVLLKGNLMSYLSGGVSNVGNSINSATAV